MASIRDFAITTEAVATASMVMNMPTHESGDLLIAFVNKDSNSNFNTPSGWTAQQTQVSAGAGGGVYTKRAASSSETVTFTYTSETACGVIIAVKDCYGTTEADAVSGSAKSGADDTTLPYTGVGITPGHDNCLVLHGLSGDIGYGGNALPPWINLFAGDAGANSLCVSYTQQYGSAAAITAPDHWGGVLSGVDVRGFAIAIRPATTGLTRDGYIPLSTTPCRQISAMNGVATDVDKGTWTGVGANSITSVNSKTATGVAIATTADSGINPYRGSARAAGTASKTTYNCVELNLTSTDDITNLNGLIFLTFMNLTPSDYKDCGTISQGGKYILFGSSSGNWRGWNIGGFNCKTEVADARNNVLIEFDTTDTDLATVGTPDFSALDIIQFGSMGYNAACSLLINEIYLLNYVTLAGGTTNNILDLEDLVFVVNNGCGILPLIVRAGVQATLWIPLKFGGVDPIFFSEDKKTFAFPQKADGTAYVDFHVSNNKIGIEFDGQDRGSGDVDVLYFTNCLFISPSSYYWRFASTHDAGADIDFTGSTVVNASVILRSTSPLSNMTFIDCSSFTQNNALLDNIIFDNTKVTADNIADISNCSFISGGSGHGIEITTAGTYTFTGNTFSGFGAGGTTDAAIYNNSGGAVTINVVGGDTPTIRNGAGASTTVNNNVTVKVIVKDASTKTILENARVYLKTDPGAVEIFNDLTDSNGEVETTFNYSSDEDVVGRVRLYGASKYKTGDIVGTITSNGFEITILLIPDE